MCSFPHIASRIAGLPARTDPPGSEETGGSGTGNHVGMASVDEEWTPGRGEDFLNLRLELTPPAGGFDDDDDDDDSSDEDSIHSDTPTEEAEEQEEDQDVRGGARGGRGHGDACASEDRRVRPSTVEEEKDGLDDDDDDEDLGPDERLTDETAELFRSKTPLDLTRLTASLPSSFDPSAVPASYETLHKVSYPVLSLSLQPQPQLQTSNFNFDFDSALGERGGPHDGRGPRA